MATASDPNAPEPRAASPDRVRADLSDAKDSAREFAHDMRDRIADAGGRVTEKGGEVLHAARARVEGLAEEGKDAGAERLSGIANAIWTAADDLEDSSPEIARHVRSAAEAVDGISGALHERSAGELYRDVTDFARRQPMAFFGVTALAGFALVRFARSTAGHSPGRSRHHRRTDRTRETGSESPDRGEGMAPPPMTAAQATLRGAAAQQHGKGAAGPIPTGSVGSHDHAAHDQRPHHQGSDDPGQRDQSAADPAAPWGAEGRDASKRNDQPGALP